MSVLELLPNINVVKSTKLDSRSILFLKTFLPDSLVDCRQLQEGGTLPNIDGYLDVLCPDGRAREKISVQVKHLTYPEKKGKVYYDIPMSIYAYAERHKGELVLFIACDYDSRIFYWREIDFVTENSLPARGWKTPPKSSFFTGATVARPEIWPAKDFRDPFARKQGRSGHFGVGKWRFIAPIRHRNSSFSTDFRRLKMQNFGQILRI